MPVTFRVLPELDLVHTVWTGVVTLEDGTRHNEGLRAHPDFHPGMRQLSDAREAQSEVSGPGVRGARRTPVAEQLVATERHTIIELPRPHAARHGVQLDELKVGPNRGPRVVVEEVIVTPYLGPLDFLMEIISVRYAKITGTWGFPPND